MASVSQNQRHTRTNPCVVCGGHDQQPRGKEIRCAGYDSADGKWSFCTRIEAGSHHTTETAAGQTYVHLVRDEPLEHLGTFTSHESERGTSNGAGRVVAEYPYRDESGKVLSYAVRFEPKAFKQRAPNGTWKTAHIRRVLYKLPELLASTGAVFIVEGEKDVEALLALGIAATCNPMGAGKWRAVADHARTVLAGRDLVIVADKDEAGRKHANDVRASLSGIAHSIVIVEVSTGKDASDYIATGATAGDFLALKPVELLAAGASAIELLAGADLATDEPAPEYLVLRLGMTAGSGAPHMIAGYGFAGKTLACQQLALAIAAGVTVWGGLDAKRRRVVHVDLEQGRRLTKRRYQRLARAMNVDLAALGDALVVAVRPDLKLTAEHGERWLTLMRGRDLLVLDSLRAATPGIDENSSEIRSVIDFLGGLSEDTGCRVLFIHHARKPTADSSASDRYAVRGSSAIYDACDAIYVFSALKGEPVKVECVKARDHGELAEDLALEIVDVADDHDPRAGLAIKLFGTERITQLREERSAKAEAEALARLRPVVVRAVTQAFIAGAPLTSIDAIRQRVRANKTLTARVVQDACETGDIHRAKVGRSHAYCPGRATEDHGGPSRTEQDGGPGQVREDQDPILKGPVLRDAKNGADAEGVDGSETEHAREVQP